MSRYLVALSALATTACWSWSAPVPVQLETLLPAVADLPPGAETEDLRGEEQMVLSIALDAPADVGLPDDRTFEPPECGERNDRSDAAHLDLIGLGAGRAVRVDGERSYVVLVSAAVVDMAAVSDVCENYRTSSASVRTEKVDLPAGLAPESAVILSEVADPDNPEWRDDATMLGYALVNGYSVMVLGFQGADFRAEFSEVLQAAVAKVAENT